MKIYLFCIICKHLICNWLLRYLRHLQFPSLFIQATNQLLNLDSESIILFTLRSATKLAFWLLPQPIFYLGVDVHLIELKHW